MKIRLNEWGIAGYRAKDDETYAKVLRQVERYANLSGIKLIRLPQNFDVNDYAEFKTWLIDSSGLAITEFKFRVTFIDYDFKYEIKLDMPHKLYTVP